MISDISKINLQSKFFAKLVKADSPIEDLKYGVVYVKTNDDSEWNEAVAKVKADFAESIMRGSWLIKYDVEVLPKGLYSDEDLEISKLLGDENNLIMPVFLPDRNDLYYFVGSVPGVKNLEAAASILTVDAQNLMTDSIPYALSAMEEARLSDIIQGIIDNRLRDDWAEEVKKLNSNTRGNVAFRGMLSPKPLSVFGDAAVEAAAAVENGELSYKNRRKLIMDLPSAVKKFNSADSQTREAGKIGCAQALAALSEHEMVLLCSALFTDAKIKHLKNIVTTIADRESLGAQTKYKLVIKERKADYGELYNIKDYHKFCLFVADGDKLQPVKMSKSSLAIYTMSLIEKVTKNKKYAIVDVKANKKAFAKVYECLFCSYNEGEVEKQYVELFKRNVDKPNVPLRTGRLPENYKEIEASLQNAFKTLDEDYSPFLANSKTPLAITAEKIILPKCLQNIEIR